MIELKILCESSKKSVIREFIDVPCMLHQKLKKDGMYLDPDFYLMHSQMLARPALGGSLGMSEYTVVTFRFCLLCALIRTFYCNIHGVQVMCLQYIRIATQVIVVILHG